MAPEVDPSQVISAGASNLVASMEKLYPSYVQVILEAYNKAIQAVFIVPLVLSALAIFGAIAMEWTNIKEKPKSPSSEAETGSIGDKNAFQTEDVS
jgi:hypothetical protein